MKLFGYNITKEKRAAPETSTSNLTESLLFGGIYSQHTAMNLSAVFRAVSIISDTISVLPLKVKTNEEDMPNHAIKNLFKGGLGYMNQSSFIKLLVQSVLLKGNGFAYIERAEDGTPIQLRYLEPTEVQVFYDKTRDTLHYTSNYIKGKIEPCNMIHLYRYSYDGINGLSVLNFAARSVTLANNTENAASEFFKSGCNLAGILKCDSVLSDVQKRDIRQNWSQTYGSGGSGLAVLSGNMEYQPIQLSSAESQLLESRLFNVEDIARWFSISPILLGDYSKSSYNSIEAIQSQFLLHTLQPYITMIEQEFTRKLFKPSEQYFSINLDENVILKTDKTAQANYYSTLLEKGVLSPNEVRKELGYKQKEGLDKHVIAYTDIAQNEIKTEHEKAK